MGEREGKWRREDGGGTRREGRGGNGGKLKYTTYILAFLTRVNRGFAAGSGALSCVAGSDLHVVVFIRVRACNVMGASSV